MSLKPISTTIRTPGTRDLVGKYYIYSARQTFQLSSALVDEFDILPKQYFSVEVDENTHLIRLCRIPGEPEPPTDHLLLTRKGGRYTPKKRDRIIIVATLLFEKLGISREPSQIAVETGPSGDNLTITFNYPIGENTDEAK